MEEVEDMWQRYCQAKEMAEQYVFPIIVLFDHTICSEYEDLKKDYNEEHKELFVKNVDFILSKIA